MIDAKLKGEGIELSEPAEPDRTNVVDLMAALKKSLGQEKPEEKKAAPAKKARAADRKQPASSYRSGRQARRKGRGSGDDQAFAQAGLSPLPFFPAFNPDLSPLLFEADDAVNIGLGNQVSSFVIAKTTLGALEPDLRNPTLSAP